MKKIISVIITLMLMLSFAAVGVSAAPKLNYTSFNLTLGYQMSLKVTGNSGSVQWGSSDTSVATVSGGTVVGKSIGTAVISAVVDGQTLRSTVRVVATNITADKSTVTVDKGQYTTVTFTVNGDKSGLTVSSGNTAIAKGSWAGAKWNGNKITLRITGVQPGTSTVTVYRKNYKSSYFKTITVTVPGSQTPPAEPAAALTVSSNKVSVNAGASSPVQVYSSATLSAYSTDTAIATVAAGTSSGTIKTFNITGVKAGTATVRIYDRTNQSVYTDIAVTVTGSTYYIVGLTRPATTGTDQVVTFAKNSVTYYMLVPANYDEADVNTAIAKYFKTYDYYLVYADNPTSKAYGDSVRNFTKINSAAQNPYYPYSPYYPQNAANQAYSPRYVLIPRDFDNVKLDTAIAKYLGEYEYYTIYNVRPTTLSRGDTVQSWRIVDETGVTITRYILLPDNYDKDRLDRIKGEDVEENQDFSLYTVSDVFPTNPGNGNQVFSWRTTSGKTHYMVIPTENCDFLKRNDAVYKDTGVFCYFNAYSTKPTVSDANREYVVSMYIQSGSASKLAYILVDKTDPDYEEKLQDIQDGTYYFIPQGTFAGTSIQY